MRTMSVPRFYPAAYMVVLLHVWLINFTSASGTSNAEPPQANTGPDINLLANSPFSISSSPEYGQRKTGQLACSGRKTSKATIKPLEMIMQAPWAPKLQDVLTNMVFQTKSGSVNFQPAARRQVTVVFGDAKYVLSLLNWLVSALVVTTPPLKNIIVISLDEELHALLEKKGIQSVHVNPETVTCGQIKRKVSQVWITRCVVYRLLNHWGYDVMTYDTDAIVLRNIQDILDKFGESDIIGSAGSYPFNLGAEWGQTLCMGAVLFKSTRKTERLWTAVSHGRRNLRMFDDQVAINNALYKCGMKWSNASCNNSHVIGQCAESGGDLSGFTVTILPTNMICRKCYKKDKSGVYIWHKQSKKTGAAKRMAAVTTETWYLRSDDIDSLMMETREVKGIEWIRAIANL